MKLLCLSNGHGEDGIALRVLQALQQHPTHPKLAALPLVGEGWAYRHGGIHLVGPTKAMPSGGFVYMDGRQLARDLQGGLLQLTWQQLRAVRAWAKEGGTILAVGDIVPLLFAWLSGAPYAFIGTAKSDYYLRDEAGWLPRQGWFERLERWSGSVYLPWERWLMGHRRCKAVFPRDTLTSEGLRRWAIPAVDLGNPMMDGLQPAGISFIETDDHGQDAQEPEALPAETLPEIKRPLTMALLPGSRAPEVHENWQLMTRAVAGVMAIAPARPLLFLGAIAPSLELTPFAQLLIEHGWQQQHSAPDLKFTLANATLVLTQTAFSDCLHYADFAIAMAGTATEQFVGLGKPAIALSGNGPQFTYAFAEAQTRLLGPSVILVKHPAQVADQVHALLNDPDRLQLISANGRRRMGPPGAARRIADHLVDCFIRR